MTEMTEEEENQAVDALSSWFQSQDISPADAVPILIKGIVVALVCACHGQSRTETLKGVREGVKLASGMLSETLDNMVWTGKGNER